MDLAVMLREVENIPFEMDFDRKDGFSYLDGVPVKISPKFCPPRPVSMPLALDAEFPSDLLALQYDFSLEKSVLESERRRKAELEDKSVANDGPTNIGSTLNISNKDGFNQTINVGLDSALKPNVHHVLPWQPDIILQPKPQQSVEKVSNGNETEDAAKRINLSDFENDTSSPFDYMELQTINDLEELSSVFQDLHNKVSDKEESQVQDSENLEVSTSAKDEAVSNVSKSISFPISQKHEFNSEKIPNSSSEDFVYGSCNNPMPLLSGSKNDARLSFSYPSVSAVVSDFNSQSKEEVKNFVSDISYVALSEVPYISSHTARNISEMTSETASTSKAKLRGCKSYSDLCNLSELETAYATEQERSRTPPSNIFPTEVSEPLINKMDKNDHSQFINHENASSNGILNSDSNASKPFGLPDPYYELDDNERQVVDSITDMGFSRGQVARTVKHLGMDEKKVVEHLCQIQMLEESGYDSLEAEAALHLHDYNQDQAKVFLDLLNKFQDLGFEKNAIKKALVQNKNDWNKTIDALLP